MIKHILLRLFFLVLTVFLVILFCFLVVNDGLGAVVASMIFALIALFIASIYFVIEGFFLNRHGEKNKRNFNIALSLCLLVFVCYSIRKYIAG